MRIGSRVATRGLGAVLPPILLLFLTGCLARDASCGENQVFVDGDLVSCVCESGYVAAPSGVGCVACGENERVDQGVCVCEEGFTRPAPDAACAVSALGAECEDDSGCGEPFGRCVADGDTGYCTSTGCEDSSECESRWTCVVETDASYCARPPTGLGASCESASDCEGFEATYCSSQSMSCLVEGCLDRGGECYSDAVCCDFSTVIGVSLCLPPSALDDAGECPFGAGKPVMQ